MAFIVIEFPPNNPTGKAIAIFAKQSHAEDFVESQEYISPLTYSIMDTEELNASTIREYVIEITATPD